jgi:prophage maintenance system killer protein
MFRVARAPAFGEANKRTALLLARWVLDRNGMNGSVIIPPEDRVIADLLVQAAAGQDVVSASGSFPLSLGEPATT